MKYFIIKYIFILSLLCSFYASHGQAEIDGLTQDSTLLEEDIFFAESGKKNKEGFFSMFEGNPGRAALYSAIIPGAGQIYNKKWLKAPVVWGLEGTAIVMIGYYGRRYRCFDLGYKGILRGEISESKGFTDANAIKVERDKVKKYRDYAIIGLAVSHVLNIADAFVDRHLIEFDVDEDISFQLGPAQHGIGITMTFR